MHQARSTWTDERLDDLSRRVDDLSLRMENRFNSIDARLNSIDARIDALQRTMVHFGGASTVGILATLVTVVLTRG
jgi:tetrahydromethanopterin S-methyltransferase subunit G